MHHTNHAHSEFVDDFRELAPLARRALLFLAEHGPAKLRDIQLHINQNVAGHLSALTAMRLVIDASVTELPIYKLTDDGQKMVAAHLLEIRTGRVAR